jgi:hypothetical protein
MDPRSYRNRPISTVNGIRAIIIAITSVDTAGNARLVLMRGASCRSSGCSQQRQPAALQLIAKIEQGRLSFTSPYNHDRTTFEIDPNGQLRGTTVNRNGKTEPISLPLIGCLNCEPRVL